MYEIFMDLHKAYNALGKDIFLEVLVGYGVGPQDRHILWDYWDILWMVARAGGYYWEAFKAFQGVM